VAGDRQGRVDGTGVVGGGGGVVSHSEQGLLRGWDGPRRDVTRSPPPGRVIRRSDRLEVSLGGGAVVAADRQDVVGAEAGHPYRPAVDRLAAALVAEERGHRLLLLVGVGVIDALDGTVREHDVEPGRPGVGDRELGVAVRDGDAAHGKDRTAPDLWIDRPPTVWISRSPEVDGR